MNNIHALHEHVQIIQLTDYICKIGQRKDKDFVLEFTAKLI